MHRKSIPQGVPYPILLPTDQLETGNVYYADIYFKHPDGTIVNDTHRITIEPPTAAIDDAAVHELALLTAREDEIKRFAQVLQRHGRLNGASSLHLENRTQAITVRRQQLLKQAKTVAEQ